MSRPVLSILLAMFALPSLAFADALGTPGRIRELEVNTIHAEAYLQYHGRIVVGSELKGLTEYRWGGTSCGTRTLTVDAVASLQSAMTNGLRIVPRHQEGQGDIKCLVGFSIAD